MGNSRPKLSRSVNFPRTDSDMAREAIDLGMKAYRQCFSRLRAIELLAPFLGMTPRRLRGILSAHLGYAAPRERHRIRMGVVKALERFADHLGDMEKYWRQRADELACHERQLVLWVDTCQPGSYPRRVA